MGQCMDKAILAGAIFMSVAKCVRPMFGGLAYYLTMVPNFSIYTSISIKISLRVISAYTSWCAESHQRTDIYLDDRMKL